MNRNSGIEKISMNVKEIYPIDAHVQPMQRVFDIEISELGEGCAVAVIGYVYMSDLFKQEFCLSVVLDCHTVADV